MVEQINDEFSFSTKPLETIIDKGAFVYGKEVDDLHSVDYDRVFTLTVSATQELTRKVEALEEENAQLLRERKATKVELNSLSSRMKAMEELFNATGSN